MCFGLYQSLIVFTIKLFKMKNSVFVFVFTLLVAFSCAKEKTLFVSNHYADCVGSSPQRCLMVKENQGDEWQLFYDQIEGFNYEEGYFYELKVKVTPVKNPPADGSTMYYTLIKVVSKTKVEALPVQSEGVANDLEGSWETKEIVGFDNQTGVKPTFAIHGGKINGKNGCNNFGGNISIGNQGKLSIGDLFQTKMFCMDEAALEMRFMEAIRNTAEYKVENNSLFLLDSIGQTILIAIPQESKQSDKSENVIPKTLPYSIQYEAISRGFSSKLQYDGKVIKYTQNQDKVDKTISVSEKDRKEIDRLFQKLDVNALESVVAPSTKHQFDGAPHAMFSVEMGDTTYRVPTFDHGTPPEYIKALLEKLEKIASE